MNNQDKGKSVKNIAIPILVIGCILLLILYLIKLNNTVKLPIPIISLEEEFDMTTNPKTGPPIKYHDFNQEEIDKVQSLRNITITGEIKYNDNDYNTGAFFSLSDRTKASKDFHCVVEKGHLRIAMRHNEAFDWTFDNGFSKYDDNQWHQYFIKLGDSGVSIYMDGDLLFTHMSTISLDSFNGTINSMIIGGNRDEENNDPNQWAFIGSSKNFRIYDNNLSEEQRLKLLKDFHKVNYPSYGSKGKYYMLTATNYARTLNINEMEIVKKSTLGTDTEEKLEIDQGWLYPLHHTFTADNLHDGGANFAHTIHSSYTYMVVESPIEISHDEYVLRIKNRQDCCSDRILGTHVKLLSEFRERGVEEPKELYNDFLRQKTVWKSPAIIEDKPEYIF